MNSAIS
jgi:hypothetical protein